MPGGQQTVQSSAWRWRVQGTSRLARARQVQSQAGVGLARLRQQIKCTQYVKFLGSARAARSVVVLPAPMKREAFLLPLPTLALPKKSQLPTQEIEKLPRLPTRGPWVGWCNARFMWLGFKTKVSFTCTVESSHKSPTPLFSLHSQ